MRLAIVNRKPKNIHRYMFLFRDKGYLTIHTLKEGLAELGYTHFRYLGDKEVFSLIEEEQEDE